MEYELQRSEVFSEKVLFEGNGEKSIDINFSLPDYCYDIQKILKCLVSPKIVSKQLSGKTLEIEGSLGVKVLYIDAEKKKLRCCDYSVPFSHSFDIKNTVDDVINPVVSSKTVLEYVNCRAVTSRKLDIHGAFSIIAKICLRECEQFVSKIDDEMVEQKKDLVEVSDLRSKVQQQFSVNEVLELPTGKNSIENIVHSDVKVCISGIKIIENKVILKGEILAKLLYMSNIENADTDVMEYGIPLNQIIDVDGVNEGCICDVNVQCVYYRFQIHSDSSDENRLIDFDVKLCCTVSAYSQMQLSVLTDAYSKEYEMEIGFKNCFLERFNSQINENYTSSDTINTEDNILKHIIYTWDEGVKLTTYKSDDSMVFAGKIDICILGVNSDDEVVLIEKTVGFEYNKSFGADEELMIKDAKAVVTGIDYRMDGSNNIEIKPTVNIIAGVYSTYKARMVNSAFADEEKKIPKDTAGIIVYYADKDESVWNIARAYGSSVNDICEENGLSQDTIQDNAMLVIPV